MSSLISFSSKIDRPWCGRADAMRPVFAWSTLDSPRRFAENGGGLPPCTMEWPPHQSQRWVRTFSAGLFGSRFLFEKVLEVAAPRLFSGGRSACTQRFVHLLEHLPRADVFALLV